MLASFRRRGYSTTTPQDAAALPSSTTTSPADAVESSLHESPDNSDGDVFHDALAFEFEVTKSAQKQ
eukprot:scaffold22373_cov78-Cyclotella_meneghiniana.AAC.7